MDWLTILYYIVAGIFIAADAALLFILVISVVRAQEFRPRLFQGGRELINERAFTLSKAFLKDRWDAILAKINGTPESLKLAIIAADNLADGLLKDMRLEGEHMADRLEQLTKEDFSAIDRLKRAHAVRNRLVHEPDFTLSKDQASQTLADYEEFLKEAEAI